MNLLAEWSQLSLKTNNRLPSSVLMFGKSTKETSAAIMKDSEKCLDPHLWHACAGGMVQMPSINSKVYYFPQGHAEHAQSPTDFGTSPKIPPFILSRVIAVELMADPETDEVFAKIHLVPVRQNELDSVEDEGIGLNGNASSELQEKTVSFAKALTQSDANNGGGFSVPRYCAETIFPRLDYSAKPPVQSILAKDVHGEIWKFKHIYRGTPRRHLLTTGWSTFVNAKKLVAGDSIVFLRTENGDLCVGIRRTKGGIGGGPELPCGWNPPTPFSVFAREEEKMLTRAGGYGGRVRVKGDSVIEASRLAAIGQPFEVLYYPRASTPEFCVKAESVRAGLKVQWCPGMRFKMAFETEDSSRISWFMGTISSVDDADRIQWPNSPWRLLQVAWDEPDLLRKVKRVNPWLVELVPHLPRTHLPPLSPPRKKPRNSDFPLNISSFPNWPEERSFAGIQGARHAQYGISLSDIHLNNLQSELFHAGFSTPTKFTASLFVGNDNPRVIDDDISCLLTIGSPCTTDKACGGKKMSQLVLFGQTIRVAGEQISAAGSSPGYGLSDLGEEQT